jgi:cytochrome b subunit of formate dehydrogenase
MTKSEQEQHQACLDRFIELANQMTGEGASRNVVSAAMMSASAVYATYVATGNAGGLTESGVDKVVAAYKQHVQRVQQIRKTEDDRRRAEAAGKA